MGGLLGKPNEFLRFDQIVHSILAKGANLEAWFKRQRESDLFLSW
jgi:hypothetical protein